jgi:phosphate transport system protein
LLGVVAKVVMSKLMHQNMEDLHQDIQRLASLVEEAIDKAILALRRRDVQIAEQVIRADDAIDGLENQIDDEAVRILALHHPVASDLRRVAMVLMITTDLERMGDLAVEIAERAVHLASLPAIAVPPQLQQMTDLTTSMVRQSLEAFMQLDTRQARRVCRFDDEVNRHNCEIIEEIVRLMRQGPEMIDPGVSLFSAVRHLERIADHATNIAEDVIYLVEGEIVRHRPEAVARE